MEAARAAGVHLAFLSGNEVFWKTRWEASTDPSATPYRTLVCYKETRDGKPIDPPDPPTWTGSWRDPSFSPPADGGRPENALTGQFWTVDSWRSDTMTIPYPMTLLRFWRNTNVAKTAAGKSASLVQNYLGYEWDESPDNGFRPAGLIHLSSTTLAVQTYLFDYGINRMALILPRIVFPSTVIRVAARWFLVPGPSFGCGVSTPIMTNYRPETDDNAVQTMPTRIATTTPWT